MNPYEGEVPVGSAEDWRITVTDPERKAFELVGVAVADLTDAQVHEASERILDEFDGQTPDLVHIGRIVDSVRFVEREKAVTGSADEQSPVASASPSTSPTCTGCRPRFRAHTPTGGGWFHEHTCPLSPYLKIVTRPGAQRLAKDRERRAESHRVEDARTGLYVVPRPPKRIPASAVHPACKAAFSDGATPCRRCTPLLHPAVCECEICDQWWNDVDGGRD